MDNMLCPTLSWDDCPPEILLIIFGMLDVKSLINCMVVSKTWWNVGCDIVQRIGKEQVVALALADRGASFRKKTNLNIYDIILNLGLWQDLHLATSKTSYIFQINEPLNLNVYKDKIIVICHFEVKYYDIKSHKMVKELPITCIDFDENDHMFLKLQINYNVDSNISKFKTLSLYGKNEPNSKMEIHKVFSHTSVLCHRLFENCCYFTISEYCIFVAIWTKETWITQLVARYFGFGTIIDMNIYQDNILALLNWGGMLQVDHGGVKFKMNKRKRSSVVLEIPKYSLNVSLYGKNGAIASVPFDKPLCLKLNEPAYWVLECPDLSCMLKHGNMIFLGYNTGKVEIFNPIQFEQKDITNLVPLFSVSVQKLAGEELLRPSVRRLEVVEVNGAHILFIVTASYVFQLTLSYRLAELA